ncbi:glycosyltransferase [Stakelama tenebrarum]|uniref:Glucuronosyltransferase n=1 Tax=Stakelama tenebrarum TaxID=2711215 RepID=A0A6G6Y481_9SPHN|nr:glycosyltransferase [Sphingosinithalassobacter tenebrarum]QIG79528.1 glucuronosyltransferase [Sphingosinithalassobacter tenebrarum]
MILLTVGTQLPFDRLVRLVDTIAPELSEAVFAQIGASSYEPKNMKWRSVVDPIEFETMIEEASFIVSHAGIGTVVMAQRHLKPLILFPRLSTLREHRNDHQLATIQTLEGREGIHVARDEEELRKLLIGHPLPPPAPLPENPERLRLRTTVGEFIEKVRLGQRV